MTNPDPVAGGQNHADRVSADPAAAVALALRLAQAAEGLAAVRGEFTTLLLDIDAAVGADGAADAFRTGFAPAATEVAASLRDAEERLGEHRRALETGVDALVGADADASAHLGRSAAR